MNYGDDCEALEAVDLSTRKAAARGSTSEHAASALHAFTTATTYSDACAATLDMLALEDHGAPPATVAHCARPVPWGWRSEAALLLAVLRNRPEFLPAVLTVMGAGLAITANHPNPAVAVGLLALGIGCVALLTLGDIAERSVVVNKDVAIRCALGAADPAAAGHIACYWSHIAGLDPDATRLRLLQAQATERAITLRVEELYAAIADGRRERWPALDAEPVKRAYCHLDRHRRVERCPRPPGLDRPAASPRQATAPPAPTSCEVGYPAHACA